MIKNRYIILIICLLHCTIADAQTSGGPRLSLQRDDESLIQVHFSWQSGPNLMLAGGNFSVLTDDWNNGTLHYNTGRVGAPDLPTASVLARLPVGSTLTMNNFTIGEHLWREAIPDDFPLAPVVAGWAKDHSWPGYEPDEKTYSADAFYRGGEPIEIENLGVMGNEQLFRLTLHPVAYNPVSRSLLVDTVISATLGLKRSATTATASRLLIVSRPEFETGLQPFVQWKQQEGYIVEELYVNTHRRDSIKAQIRPYFERANPLEPAPDYLLLVGDAAQIQSFTGETMLDGEGHTTDLYYSEFTGDYLPEAMLGRWPVNDTDELSTVVEKTLRYEQFRNMDTLQLKRMLLVAGNEQYAQAPLTTNGQVNYVSHEVKLAYPEIDTLCYHNPQSANQLSEIQSDIGQGAGLLNYTAHWQEQHFQWNRLRRATAKATHWRCCGSDRSNKLNPMERGLLLGRRTQTPHKPHRSLRQYGPRCLRRLSRPSAFHLHHGRVTDCWQPGSYRTGLKLRKILLGSVLSAGRPHPASLDWGSATH